MSDLLYAEDLTVGAEFELGSHTMDEAEIIAFAELWDPQPMHIDPATAKEGPFGEVIASGLHTLGVYQRLMLPVFNERVAAGVGRGFNVRFMRPVRPGSTLTGTSRVAGVTMRGPGRDAILALHTKVRDQDGNVVLEVELDAMVRTRDPGPNAP